MQLFSCCHLAMFLLFGKSIGFFSNFSIFFTLLVLDVLYLELMSWYFYKLMSLILWLKKVCRQLIFWVKILLGGYETNLFPLNLNLIIVVRFITNLKINIIVHYVDARSNLRRKVTLLCPMLSTIIQSDFKFSGFQIVVALNSNC